MLFLLVGGTILSVMFYFNAKNAADRAKEEMARNIKDYCRDAEINELRSKLGLPPKNLT